MSEGVDGTHLIQSADIRRQPTVDAQHLAIDDSRQREVVEHIRAPPPRVGVPVLPLALVVEPVHLRDLPRLVVPALQARPGIK